MHLQFGSLVSYSFLKVKRKWERIVSRGLEKERLDSPLTGDSPNSGAMFEGIREGVQGVSRFIAYGLSSASPSSSAPHPPSAFSQSQYSSSPLTNKRRSLPAARSSTSSMSTFTTKSTRLSSSSASSFDVGEPGNVDYFASCGEEEEDEQNVLEEEHAQELLMVRDTGASPLVSPNPEFIQQKKERKRERERLERGLNDTPGSHSSPTTTAKDSETIRARRKSREVALPSSSTRIHSASSSTVTSPTVPGYPFEDLHLLSPGSEHGSSTPALTRRQSNRTSLAPISSMPGLALATMVPINPTQAVSSWVGSVVGKNWEDTYVPSAPYIPSNNA